MGRGFQDVVFIEREILAQHRDADRVPRRFQILQAALEEGAIGQNGERGSASALVFDGNPDRVEVRDDGWRPLEEFRTERAPFGALPGSEFLPVRQTNRGGTLLLLARDNAA